VSQTRLLLSGVAWPSLGTLKEYLHLNSTAALYFCEYLYHRIRLLKNSIIKSTKLYIQVVRVLNIKTGVMLIEHGFTSAPTQYRLYGVMTVS